MRKVFYGITPTTVYTTLRPMKFPDEYDPIKMLEWQLAEEKRLGITTPDFDPVLTEKTNLWDGYFNDPTFDSVTFHCMRHLYANNSRPTKLQRYWEYDWGHEKSLEAVAKYWYREALKENERWWAKQTTTKYLPLEDLTYDSVDKVRFSPNFGDSHIESQDLRDIAQAQKECDEKWEREEAPYVYGATTPSDEETERPKTTRRRPAVTEERREREEKKEREEKPREQEHKRDRPKTTHDFSLYRDTDEITKEEPEHIETSIIREE